MSPRVLIVDDSPMNLKLAGIVVRAEGYEPVVADGARAALAVLEGDLPDLILMDLQMPEIDGLELTRMLKADPRTTAIPVVALTAAAMVADRERALAAGCDGFITKPLDTRSLGAELARFTIESDAA